MAKILYPAKKDELYPEGFGLVVRPSSRIGHIHALREVYAAHHADLAAHGAIFIEREQVHMDEIRGQLEHAHYCETEKDASVKMIHTHNASTSLIAPSPSPVKTVFCSRDAQRAYFHALLHSKKAEREIMQSAALSILRIGKNGIRPTLATLLPSLVSGSAVCELSDDDLFSVTYNFYLEAGGGTPSDAAITDAVQDAQQQVSDDLLEADWERFGAGKFARRLPHGQDTRTHRARAEDLYVYAPQFIPG